MKCTACGQAVNRDAMFQKIKTDKATSVRAQKTLKCYNIKAENTEEQGKRVKESAMLPQ